jgi:hypothetical protein
MKNDLATADSRALHEPFARHLGNTSPQSTLSWLIGVLASQRPALRSSNCSLVAYTGRAEALDWLESNVCSPVTHNWGDAAALLGAPWRRIAGWLADVGPRQLMGLDALRAYRRPAPNMSALMQIAAPVLPDAPTRHDFEAALNEIARVRSNPRILSATANILELADEILSPRHRGVPVADLPKLYLNPESFPAAGPILARHAAVTGSFRQSIQDMLDRNKLN